MRVLLVGGTGTLGRQVARRALDEGHIVRCMVRYPRKAAFLQEWGCELTRGDLLEPDSINYALEGQEAVIDAATSRATEPGTCFTVDWTGQQNLFHAVQKSSITRFIFFSILNAYHHLDVPLMEIKARSEDWLKASHLDYTILHCAAFMQGLIGQYAIPILEGQTVWVSGVPTPIAYMNTQDLARFAVASLHRDQTIRQIFPVVGPHAWTTGQITQLCERYSGKEAKIARVPPLFLHLMRSVANFFDASVNVAERLAFDQVTGGGQALDAPMEASYDAFGLDPAETTSLEQYLQEYYQTILKRLKDMEADLDKDAKKKLPF
ncbi:MAG: hypothetical protein RLZZ117_2420 [Cyanobacteriota bacterium]